MKLLQGSDDFVVESQKSCCNIPPVSIGILPVNRARGLNLRKISMDNIYYAMFAKYG
jgi:hypothetical protein